jgi:hypothetical protein
LLFFSQLSILETVTGKEEDDGMEEKEKSEENNEKDEGEAFNHGPSDELFKKIKKSGIFPHLLKVMILFVKTICKSKEKTLTFAFS